MKTNRLVVNGKIEAYSKTAVDAIYQHGGAEALIDARNQIFLLIEQLRSNPKFVQFVKSENIADDKREAIVKEIFAGFNPVLLQIIGTMARNHDLRLWPRVLHAYDDHMANDYNLVACDVTTAVELDDNLRKIIGDKVKRETGKDAIINEHIDKSMLGGVVMTIPGKRIDASVRAQLNKARIELKKHNGGESK
jgi:F-type H+-transporting ATPase subunit delta